MISVNDDRWEPEIVDSQVHLNPHFGEIFSCRPVTCYGHDGDYDIPGLSERCDKLSQQQSRMVWNVLLGQYEWKRHAFYSANASDPRHEAPARYVCTLRDSSWIVCNDGVRRKPSEAVLEQIPEDWVKPEKGYDTPALKAIGFGLEYLEREAKRRNQELMFKEYGFDGIDEVDDLKQIKKLCQERGIEPKDALAKLSLEKDMASTPHKQPKGAFKIVSRIRSMLFGPKG